MDGYGTPFAPSNRVLYGEQSLSLIRGGERMRAVMGGGLKTN